MKHVHIERVENGWIITGKEQPENGVFVVEGKTFVFNNIQDLTSELPTLLSVETPIPIGRKDNDYDTKS